MQNHQQVMLIMLKCICFAYLLYKIHLKTFHEYNFAHESIYFMPKTKFMIFFYR